MTVDIKLLKQLREDTQVSIADCRKALEETNNDLGKAKEWLRKHGIEKAGKKAERETKAGIIDTYIHHTMVSGATVALMSETDFVARTDEFKSLAHEIAKQVTATDPKDEKQLLNSPWIKDESKTISDLLKEHIAKLGENITVQEFKRFEIGKKK